MNLLLDQLKKAEEIGDECLSSLIKDQILYVCQPPTSFKGKGNKVFLPPKQSSRTVEKKEWSFYWSKPKPKKPKVVKTESFEAVEIANTRPKTVIQDIEEAFKEPVFKPESKVKVRKYEGKPKDALDTDIVGTPKRFALLQKFKKND